MAINAPAAAYLSLYAYIDSNKGRPNRADFVNKLANIPLGAEGPWTLVWGPAENDGILLYLCKNNRGEYALAYRGTNTNDDVIGFFQNLLSDGLLDLVPWLYPYSGQPLNHPKITAGMNQALALALATTDPTTGDTLLRCIQSNLVPNGSNLTVTGHSLGGALALLTTLWLIDQLPRWSDKRINLSICTFGAPTICDQSFSDKFSRVLRDTNTRFWEYKNTNDIIPMCCADINLILKTFPPPGPILHDDINDLTYDIIYKFLVLDSYFKRMSPSDPRAFTVTPELIWDGWWPDEVPLMHSMEKIYLRHVLNADGLTLPPPSDNIRTQFWRSRRRSL